MISMSEIRESRSVETSSRMERFWASVERFWMVMDVHEDSFVLVGIIITWWWLSSDGSWEEDDTMDDPSFISVVVLVIVPTFNSVELIAGSFQFGLDSII